MTVEELIKALKDIKDQTLPIRVIDNDFWENNKWVTGIGSINNTGDSGYEESGEVVLLIDE